ncbi:MAG TPA: ABC transporter ATP-binding protein [Synergistaceae bacterium]|nr:ABC transporter ATP-binding protein [Synergistaceae bacterium]HPJ25445.1 ABC transporter ATP-binding protein [Synergistaceae bacterium]HPQ36708.1 ABC transporter ATP-binding protein [Synergistaceae bacterium]
MLKVSNLRAGYDDVAVLYDLSFHVEPGEVVALVGANGAGKSTTMRCLSGLMRPWQGNISFCGEDVAGLPAASMVQKGLCYVPEGRRLFGKLSVRENLLLGAYLQKDEKEVEERLDFVLSLFPRVKERLSQTAETMSGGEQQMLAIARGLMSMPKLIMIDEMSLGLMPSLVEKVMETIKDIKKAGITVFLVEQMVQDALEIADRGYVLQSGKIVLEGAAGDLLASEEVQKAYLGM